MRRQAPEASSDSAPRRLAATTPAAESRRGRGATANPDGRFEASRREAFDDGWGAGGGPPPPAPPAGGERAGARRDAKPRRSLRGEPAGGLRRRLGARRGPAPPHRG